MNRTSEKFYFRNEVVEPRNMMTLQELIDHCHMNGIPRDAVLVFRGNRKDPKSDRNVVDVLQVHKHAGEQPGGITYVILGGHE